MSEAANHQNGQNARAKMILEAADSLFGELGFDGTSVRDIAERAGVNKALVFYYFDSKDALFERVVGTYYEGHHIVLEEAFARGGSIAERLHYLADAYVDYIDENRNFPRLMQRRLSGRSDADTDLVRRGMEPLLKWTERALEGLTPPEGALAARHLFLTFSGAVINFFTYGPVLGASWGLDPRSEEGVAERKEHLHWLVDAMLNGLKMSRNADSR